MIIRPARRSGFSELSDYLSGEDYNRYENEECNFIVSGNSEGMDTIQKWCMYAANLSKPKRQPGRPFSKPIEHISIRTRDGDILTPSMILSKIPELLECLTDYYTGSSYKDCPWMLVQHLKRVSSGNVEPHYHLAICRVDDKGRVPDPFRIALICVLQSCKFALEFGFRPAYEGKNANSYIKMGVKLVGLWDDAETMKPAARALHFIRNGFVLARGHRRQVLFVEKSGKRRSPHCIPITRTTNMKDKDIAAYFAIDAGGMRSLPAVNNVTASIRSAGWKRTSGIIRKGISHGLSASARYDFYARYHGNSQGSGLSLFQLRSRDDIGWRCQRADEFLPAKSIGSQFFRPQTLQPAATPARRRASTVGVDNANGFDPSLSARASAAAATAAARFDAAIEDVQRDPNLSSEDKTAKIAVLRLQQRHEAEAAQKRVLEQGKPDRLARRRDYSILSQ